MATFANKEHQFLADLGLAPRNPGSYACGAWGGSVPVVTTTNPTNNKVIAEVVEASVDDYEKGVSACFDAAKTWMAEVVFLDDEDRGPAKSVDVEMVNKWDEGPQMYYPSRTDPETVELTYYDLQCLEPKEFLKSPVINFYIQVIVTQSLASKGDGGKVYIFLRHHMYFCQYMESQ